NKLIAAENSEVSKEDSAAIKLSLKAKGVEILENLYEKGIIQINSAIEGKDPEFPLVITENNVAEDRLLGDFHSIQSAYRYINENIIEHSLAEQAFLRSLLENFLQQNVVYDEETTESALQSQLSKISLTTGLVQKGQKIVDQGKLLNEEDFRIVNSLKAEFE